MDYWLKRIIAAVTGTCIFGDAAFLGSALGYLIAMCSSGWENLVAFDGNDLPVGSEFDGKFLKNVKSPPHAPLPPPPLAGFTLIGALFRNIPQLTKHSSLHCREVIETTVLFNDYSSSPSGL